MSDLIRRDELLEELKSWAVVLTNPIYYLIEDADHIIKSVSSVDAIEVVRCKDCKSYLEYSKFYEPKVEGATGDCAIRLFHSDFEQFCAVKADDFCSYGKRKVP